MQPAEHHPVTKYIVALDANPDGTAKFVYLFAFIVIGLNYIRTGITECTKMPLNVIFMFEYWKSCIKT